MEDMHRRISFRNGRGLRLVGDLTTPNGAGPFPAVVILHGFGHTRASRRYKYRSLIGTLVRAGCAVLWFDMTGVGNSQGSITELTPHAGVDDAITAVRFLRKQPEVDRERIGIFGNSFGGVTGLVAAAKQPGGIGALVLKAPAYHWSGIRVADLRELPPKTVWRGRRGRYRTIVRGRDFSRSGRELVSPSLVRRITAPTVILHGSTDRIEYARKLHQLLSSPKKLSVFQGGGHQLRGTKEEAQRVEREAADWFRKYL